MRKFELSTINHGAVFDLFGRELEKVIENIGDENTEAKKERSITIKIAIRPDKSRRAGEVRIQASSSLATVKPAESLVFFDRDRETGIFAAFEDDPGPELPGIEQEAPAVVPFPRAQNGG